MVWFELWLLSSIQSMWYIARMRSTQFYYSGQTFPPLHLCLLLNLRVKYVYGIFRIVANSSQHENETMSAEFREEYFKHKQIVKFHHRSYEIAVWNHLHILTILLCKGNTKVFFNKVNKWDFVQKVTFFTLNATENLSLICKCY